MKMDLSEIKKKYPKKSLRKRLLKKLKNLKNPKMTIRKQRPALRHLLHSSAKRSITLMKKKRKKKLRIRSLTSTRPPMLTIQMKL